MVLGIAASLIIVCGCVVLLLNTRLLTPSNRLEAVDYSEADRPQFHYSAPTGWMNDPNGLVYDQGEYHLFYQADPSNLQPQVLNWGHTASTDLLHWSNLQLALKPDKLGLIYSGSIVVDA